MKVIHSHEVASNYNNLDEIWKKSDKWHWITHTRINSFVYNNLNIYSHEKSLILNAGSGGNNYGLNNSCMWHLDIAEKKFRILAMQ